MPMPSRGDLVAQSFMVPDSPTNDPIQDEV